MQTSTALNLSLGFWILMAPGIVLFVVGWLLVRRGKRKLLVFDRYRFENRSSGGMVTFDSFGASQKFHRKEGRVRLVGSVGILMGCVGFVWMFAVFLLINRNWEPFR